jgi:endonuclease III
MAASADRSWKRRGWPGFEPAATVLQVVDTRLRSIYGDVRPGSAPLGNKRNPLDELIFIQLSVRTRESAYHTTYRALRALVERRWERLLILRDLDVLRELGTGGMASVKLARIRGQLQEIRREFGRYSLAPLRKRTTEQADAFLQSLPGVGPKVSRCVLLYSLDREVFPVDSNCFRILDRLGLIPGGTHPKAAHDPLQELTPPSIRRSLHVNLVRHGRDTCLPAEPRCARCVLLSICPTGLQRTADLAG